VTHTAAVSAHCAAARSIVVRRIFSGEYDMAESRIGYIDIYGNAKDGYVGGVLVTDRIGVPVEFRHTENVNPGKLQKILYGRSLERFLKCESLAKCLLSDLENKPDILIVPDPEYFLLTRAFSFPFVQISRAAKEPLTQHGEVQEISESEIILQVLSLREPLRVKVDRKNAPTLASVKTLLLDLGRTMDLLEPMSRVQEALKEILGDMTRLVK